MSVPAATTLSNPKLTRNRLVVSILLLEVIVSAHYKRNSLKISGRHFKLRHFVLYGPSKERERQRGVNCL